jgi:drug/metabolite transporter (DMT)-like permease
VNRGVILALAAAVLFGASTPLAKLLLGAVSPILLAGLLYSGSGLGLLLVLVARRLRRAPEDQASSLPRRGQWGWLAAAIFFGGVAGPLAFMYGLATTAASTTALLLNLEAVFTALLAWALFRENWGPRLALGVLSIVAGGLILGWSPAQAGHVLGGTPLIVAACFFWALDNNLTRKVAACDAVWVASLKGLVAGSVNVCLALAFGAAVPGIGTVSGAAVVGFLGYGVSLVLFVLALRYLGSARTVAYFSVAPFFGASVALLFQTEPASWQLGVAGILMALGVWLHLSERHTHLHVHQRQEHTHSHVHDEHHQHAHESWDGREPHTHAHVHSPFAHSHPHYPDIHHQHPH